MSDSNDPPEADVLAALSDSENEYDDHDPDSQLREEHDKMGGHHGSPDLDGNGEVKKKYDPKDPTRPRRKKARRACYACQRAHLTCGTSKFSQFLILLSAIEAGVPTVDMCRRPIDMCRRPRNMGLMSSLRLSSPFRTQTILGLEHLANHGPRG